MYKNVKISKDELNILKLPKRVDALEVANKLKFPTKTNFSGNFQIELTPYLKLPISLIGKTNQQWVFLIKPTQSGGTVFLQVVIADTIDQDPGPLIYITPNEKLTEKGMTRIGGIVERTKDLSKHVPNKRSISKSGIDLDNMKVFASWAGSLGALSETPAKRVILDEIRLMPLTKGAESNAIKMGDDRLTTYKSQGLAQGFGVSTPSVEGDLLHQQLTIPNTTVLRWAIKCENCGKLQILDFWKNVKLENRKPICKCISCGFKFDDRDRKKRMNSFGSYVEIDPSKPYSIKNADINTVKMRSRVICWYSSLESPFRSWVAIYNEFVQTRNKLHDYKNFAQCWLSRFWVDDISKTSVESLKNRRVSHLDKGTVPSWTRVLLGGIDTQDDGFYVVIRSFGENKRTHLVDHYFITCQMSMADAPIIHNLIKKNVEERIFTGEDENIKWRVAAYGWDTGGHRTKQIYAAVKKGLQNAIMVKGAQEYQNVTIRYNKELNLYLVRTVEYLDETEKHCMTESFTLPDNVGKDYLKHFTNRRKKRDINKKSNEEKIIWYKMGKYDYRMADIHSWICLDIPYSDGTFRNRLNQSSFIHNPMVIPTEEVMDDAYFMDKEFDEDGDDVENYEIGELSNWNT